MWNNEDIAQEFSVNTHLLITKLFVPSPRPQLVSRPHLIELLNARLHTKLTVVSAPAGFGKTTLISEWVDTLSIPCAWVTLDKNDCDLGRFLAYIIYALNSAGNDIDDSVLAILQSSQIKTQSSFLDPLINQLSISSSKTILVLDDYHLITSEEVHEAMDYLIGNQPPNLHIVVSGRADPPLSLARLRANGQLVELRATDFKFSNEEGQKYIRETQDLDLGDDEIKKLIAHTEGWIAGLQLAALSLHGISNRPEYINGLSGNTGYIADYFVDEVLNQQPPYIQEFLLKTSILNRLNAELCQIVTDQPESAKVLKEILVNNLFLIPIDEEQHWFRYHRLFLDLLYQRLLNSEPDIIPFLYLKASEWSEDQGLLSEALEYALEGKHFERAAGLISREVEPMLMRSEFSTYISWIEKLPEEILQNYPLLSIYYSWALMITTLQPEKAQSHLENLSFDIPEDEYRCYTVKSMIALFQTNLEESVKYSSLALENLPRNDLFFRSSAAWNLSAALYMSGDAAGGESALEEAVKISREGGYSFVTLSALCRQGQTFFQQGYLHKPKDSFEQALELAQKENGAYLPVASEALLGLGKVYLYWNELDIASNYISDCIELSKRWRESVSLEGYIALAKISQAQGDGKQANAFLEIANKISKGTTDTKSDDIFVNLNQANLWILQGNLQTVERWIKERKLDMVTPQQDESIGAKAIRNYEKLVYARYLVVKNQPQNALQILENILPELKKINLMKKVLEGFILKAVAHAKNGNFEQALDDLRHAYRQSKPEGHIQLFVDEVQPINELLKLALEEGIEPEYTQLLLNRIHDGRIIVKTAGLVEPLSERELEVIKLLNTELMVPEISENLFVATSTVRSHIKSIYRKLDVHSRYEATIKAKELGLL